MIWLPVVGSYADIDAYASILAYTDLLNQRGKSAQDYIPIAPNYSVPSDLRLAELENRTFNLQPNDQVIILDVSDPDAIAKFVSDEQILELIDHHPGYEEYWRERIGDKAIIEQIGAVATSIFEWWGECWDYDKMSPEIAKLLLGAILDNTLNFNANITTARDRQAADKLTKIANTTLGDFTAWYFSSVSDTVTENLKTSLSQDCKDITIPGIPHMVTFAQLTLWNSKVIPSKITEIIKIMSSISSNWIASIICISEGKNYILTSSNLLESYFTNLLDLKKQNDYLVSKHLYLRKEIISKMLGS